MPPQGGAPGRKVKPRTGFAPRQNGRRPNIGATSAIGMTPAPTLLSDARWSVLALGQPGPGWLAGGAAVLLAAGLGWWLRRVSVRRGAQDDLHRFLFENAVEGIYENPVEGGFRTANPAMTRILGYGSVEELLRVSAAQTASIYVRPGRRAEFLAQLGSREILTDFESEIRRPDGTTRWISENVRAVRDSVGRLVAIQGFVTDITARKQAEVALRESEERYRGLFLANPYPMWIYDRETLK